MRPPNNEEQEEEGLEDENKIINEVCILFKLLLCIDFGLLKNIPAHYPGV